MKFWIWVSPEGCVKGSVLHSTYRRDIDAHAYFTPSSQDRVRELAHGWRIELVDEAEWSRRAQPCIRGACAHKGLRTSSAESCPVCGHLMSSHDGEPCGERWDVCDDPDCAEPRLLRWTRREQLQVLLGRMDRGVLLPEERRMLRDAVNAEVKDVERAWATVAKLRSQR
ncbi:MAG: hypothetical protein IJI97_06710 [Clostridia bacterium]|nr:hypothetical protein [Clostridia bacterium]